MSTEIRFFCPTCKTVMNATLDLAGSKVNCLKCGQRLQVPPAERAKTIMAPRLGGRDEPMERSASGLPRPMQSAPAASTQGMPNLPPATGAVPAAQPPATSKLGGLFAKVKRRSLACATIAVGATVFCLLPLCCGGYGLLRNPHVADTVSSVIPWMDSSIKLTDVQLYKEYVDNEVAANGKYNDKNLEIAGRVFEFSAPPGGVARAHLFCEIEQAHPGGQLVAKHRVDCIFADSEKASAAEMKVGQVLIVRETCKGRHDGCVELENCRSVEPKVLEVTTKHIFDEHKANSFAATGKYSYRKLRISATLTAARGPWDGGGGFEIEPGFIAADSEKLQPLAKGDKVLLEGMCVPGQNGTALDHPAQLQIFDFNHPGVNHPGVIHRVIQILECKLVRVEPVPPLRINAADLIAAYKENPAAADTKFDRVRVRITGKAVPVAKNRDVREKKAYYRSGGTKRYQGY